MKANTRRDFTRRRAQITVIAARGEQLLPRLEREREERRNGRPVCLAFIDGIAHPRLRALLQSEALRLHPEVIVCGQADSTAAPMTVPACEGELPLGQGVEKNRKA